MCWTFLSEIILQDLLTASCLWEQSLPVIPIPTVSLQFFLMAMKGLCGTSQQILLCSPCVDYFNLSENWRGSWKTIQDSWPAMEGETKGFVLVPCQSWTTCIWLWKPQSTYNLIISLTSYRKEGVTMLGIQDWHWGSCRCRKVLFLDSDNLWVCLLVFEMCQMRMADKIRDVTWRLEKGCKNNLGWNVDKVSNKSGKCLYEFYTLYNWFQAGFLPYTRDWCLEFQMPKIVS